MGVVRITYLPSFLCICRTKSLRCDLIKEINNFIAASVSSSLNVIAYID